MDLTPFSESLRADLIRAAEVGDADVRAAAERLTLALDPAIRLILMTALSEAAAEISAALDGSAVEVRLQGRDPAFVVTQAGRASHDEISDADDDGDAVARITLRLPEAVKVRAEAQATARGQSLNTWLVNAARVAATGPEDAESHRRSGGRSSRKRVQGWAR